MYDFALASLFTLFILSKKLFNINNSLKIHAFITMKSILKNLIYLFNFSNTNR
jgi:hypothetical protein